MEESQNSKNLTFEKGLSIQLFRNKIVPLLNKDDIQKRICKEQRGILDIKNTLQNLNNMRSSEIHRGKTLI